jgi:hypothetical protein
MDRRHCLHRQLAERIWGGGQVTPLAHIGRSMEPADVEALLCDAGLTIIGSGPEGTLRLAPSAETVPPIYPAERGVWETVAARPAANERMPSYHA